MIFNVITIIATYYWRRRAFCDSCTQNNATYSNIVRGFLDCAFPLHTVHVISCVDQAVSPQTKDGKPFTLPDKTLTNHTYTELNHFPEKVQILHWMDEKMHLFIYLIAA